MKRLKLLASNLLIIAIILNLSMSIFSTLAMASGITHEIDITVDNEKGMIINQTTGKAILSGQKVLVNNGESVTFYVISYGGSKINNVIYNNGIPEGQGMLKHTINTGSVTTDASLIVTFDDYKPSAPLVDSFGQVFTSYESSKPVAVSYGTIHGISETFGIILWNTNDIDVTVEQAMADSSDNLFIFSAKTGPNSKGMNHLGQFGVKVRELDYGNYKTRTYVIKGININYGETITFSVSPEPTANPTNTVTPTVEPSTTPEPTQKPSFEPTVEPFITSYLNDNFDNYASIDDLQLAGWQLSTYVPTSTLTPSPTPVSPILVSTAAPTNTKYLRAQAKTNAIRTFRPVPLCEDGGQSPGINAKLIISFDAYISGGSGDNTAYYKVDDSTTGNVAISAGRRAGAGGYIRYSQSIPATFSGLTITNSLSRFTKLKFVINITDEYGDYLSDGPNVDIYCRDMETPIIGGKGVKIIKDITTMVDRLYIGGANSIEVDNLEIGLQTNGGNAPPTALPTATPSALFIDNARTVSTFNSMSIYTNYGSSNGTAYCNVKYRKTGTNTWQEGQSLWNDTSIQEFRGSIVYLDAGTTYDIQLNYGDESVTGTYEFTGTTWDESFPVGNVTTITNENTTLNISHSGTKRAYNVWEGPTDSKGTVDVQRNANNCIVINASYVIVRNLNVTGSLKNAITINPDCHDVIIEGCNIYNWGPEGPAEDENHIVYYNFVSASAIISGDDATVYGGRRFIIQNNKIGPPTGCASSWDIGHPMGPQGISIMQSRGNNVIRFNEVIGDENHYFNDAIGGGQNGGGGNVRCDSDIYGNIARYCYDDTLEIEGYNINVRVWNNYCDKAWRTIATAQVNHNLKGPMYVFRNIFGPSGASGSGTATKLQGKGPLYFYHNMFGLPDNYMRTGILPTVNNGAITNLTTRNNIFYIPSNQEGGPISRDWRYEQDNTPNSLDYDHFIYNVRHDFSIDPDDEVHGIFTAPTLNIIGTTLGNTNYYHTSQSNGLDIAYPLPGFNDQYSGAGPDTGACEQGLYEFKAGVQ